jgi:hypothetical protein
VTDDRLDELFLIEAVECTGPAGTVEIEEGGDDVLVLVGETGRFDGTAATRFGRGTWKWFGHVRW